MAGLPSKPRSVCLYSTFPSFNSVSLLAFHCDHRWILQQWSLCFYPKYKVLSLVGSLKIPEEKEDWCMQVETLYSHLCIKEERWALFKSQLHPLIIHIIKCFLLGTRPTGSFSYFWFNSLGYFFVCLL